MAVQAISARRLCGKKLQNLVGERLQLLRHSLRIGLSLGLGRGEVNEEESLVSICLRASNPVSQKTINNSPRQGIFQGFITIGSASGHGGITGKLQSHVGTRHAHGTATVQETNKEHMDIKEEKEVGLAASATELKGQSPQLSRGGGGTIRARSTREAVAILKDRQQKRIPIESRTFVEVLKRCSKHKDFTAATQVQDVIIKSRMDMIPYVANTLMHAYIRCGRLQDARRVFDELEKKTVVTWCIMIGGYARNGNPETAVEGLLKMPQGGQELDEATWLSILKACASPEGLKWGREAYNLITRAGLEPTARVGTALIQMFAKGGCITEARRVFEQLDSRDLITWNVMIGAYAESGHGAEAYQLFLQMAREGFKPDAFTYASILNATASAGAMEWVMEVHSHALKAGLESNLRVGTALLHMYAKNGRIDEARVIFDRMEERDAVAWNTMITAYAESGSAEEAYRLFCQMDQEGCKPDAYTYVGILNAPAAGDLEWVREVHRHALRAGLESNLRVGTALVHMFAKKGLIDDARPIFARMQKRDVVTWNVMIGGLAQHGFGHEALELFSRMTAERVKPDRTSFVAVLSACCHTGLLDEGRRFFLAMTQDYGIEPTIEHCNCMVDLLGRAGHLEEARVFMGEMPVTPDRITWQSLLGACRTHGNVELGEIASTELLKLEPQNSSAYVLLSHIYAAAGKREKATSVRNMMQERGVQKEEPGISWIEVDSKIHEFVAGDTSHPEAKAIYSELDALTEKLKTEGYIPDTQLVLHNIDEDDKSVALCSHSEKLAIVYGLLRTPPGEPIRVYKNLRACSDCHTATKFISKVTGREIIARDANRFHHFQDGVCSCGDYW